MRDSHSKYQKLWNTVNAEEDMKKLKEKLNDARSKFMVRFLCPDIY